MNSRAICAAASVPSLKLMLELFQHVSKNTISGDSTECLANGYWSDTTTLFVERNERVA